jgi:hypothetical protein
MLKRNLTRLQALHLFLCCRGRKLCFMESTQPQNQRPPDSRPGALLRAAKFAFAALLAGSRAIPLGDNSCVTRDLAAYGARLRAH